MVYGGKPSGGCQNCRKRKIKCDESVPACSQCVRSNKVCPGYQSPFDLVLRDQTATTERKATKGRKKTKVGNQTLVATTSSTTTQQSWTEVVRRFSSSQIGEQAPSPILKRLGNSPEEMAVTLLFNTFILRSRHPESLRGSLECLAPLYAKTSPGSLLSLATSAVALVISAGDPRRRADYALGRRFFGKALRLTNDAIQDTTESTKDETLMAVLMLGMYERLCMHVERERINASNAHDKGAAALVKHRGDANHANEISQRLLFAVHTQITEHAIEGLGNGLSQDLNNLVLHLPQTAASRLTSLSSKTVHLFSTVKATLSSSSTTSSLECITSLIELASNIDSLVARWPENLPPCWSWVPATGFNIPRQPDLFNFVHDRSRVDIYLDLWVTAIWNSYRRIRILIHSMILSWTPCLPSPSPPSLATTLANSEHTINTLASDICASVPFCLGTRLYSGLFDKAEVIYPHVGDMHASGEHRRAAAALGGWFLLEPLQAAWRAQGLDNETKEWIEGQLRRIGSMYQIKEAVRGIPGRSTIFM